MNPANDTCEQCVKIHTATGRKTPCGPCPKPLLEPANEWIWEIFLQIQSQARVSGFGVFTGFDLSALRFLLEAHEVPQVRWSEALDGLSRITEIAMRFWNVDEKK